MDEMVDWDETCPERFNDLSGNTQHDLNTNCSCRYCGEVFHKWNGCVCLVCGEIRHVFLQYYICPICGKRVDKYRGMCHALQSEVTQKFDCRCLRCSKTVHDFQNHRCKRCSEWEEHDHVHDPLGLWDKVLLKENKLFLCFSCKTCGQSCVEEYQPQFVSRRDWRHQPFVFRNGMKAFVARDLVGLCYLYPDDGCYHLLEGHFEPWVEYMGDRNFAAVCRETRMRDDGLSSRQKLDLLISEFCRLDNRIIDSDGQSWVAGWD